MKELMRIAVRAMCLNMQVVILFYISSKHQQRTKIYKKELS